MYSLGDVLVKTSGVYIGSTDIIDYLDANRPNVGLSFYYADTVVYLVASSGYNNVTVLKLYQYNHNNLQVNFRSNPYAWVGWKTISLT